MILDQENVPMAATPQGPEARVLRQFRIIFNAVRGHFRQVERIAGIGGAQLWALSIIDSSEGCGVTELSLAMDIHQSTASNLVRSLAKGGLVQVSRNAHDKRAVILMATESGKAILASAPGPFSGVLPAALANLDPAMLLRLETDLGTLIAAIDADESLAQKPLAIS
jgi:DNA-binding MarR family transcriptional regulator